MNDDYHARSKKVVMVPVEVSYYENLDMLCVFTPPTRADIEIAFKEQRFQRKVSSREEEDCNCCEPTCQKINQVKK